MLNIAPRSTIVARFEMSEVLSLSWTDLVSLIMGWDVAGDQSSTCPGGRELISGKVYYDQWFTWHLGFCYLLHTYVQNNKTTPSNKSDPPDCPTWQPTGSFPRVASNCALSSELWAPLRMLSAGAIGRWNFLLLRIWKWGKLIWNEICISTLAGKLLPTISTLDLDSSIIFESTVNLENPGIFTSVIFVIMPKFWHIFKIYIIFSCKLTDLSWKTLGRSEYFQ